MTNIPELNDDYYRDFSLNNILSGDELGKIHYNVYVLSSYDGSKSFALYFTILGYQGFIGLKMAQILKIKNLLLKQ